MEIAFGPDGDLYICDNQGRPGKPELIRKGRILRVRVRKGKIVKTTVVAENMEHPNGMRVKDGFIYVTQSTLELVKPLSVLADKLHVYNYDLILRSLFNRDVPEEIAKDFTFSACCAFDLHYHSYRLEYYVHVPQIFLRVMK